MLGIPQKPIIIRNSMLILLSGALTTLIMFFVLRLWMADMQYVFVGRKGDASLELLGIQNLLETGSRNLSDRLGGVWGQQMYDFPAFDFLNYLIMLFISLFTKNAAVILNVFYLLTYPLAAMTAVFALLELKCSRISALFACQLFPFMSYHFFRNETHLLLSAYYMVPLGLLVVLWYMQGDIPVSFSRRKSFRQNISDNRNFLLSVLFCLMISSTGIYYAYFTCFFLILAIFKNAIDGRKWSRSTTTGVTLLLIIMAGGIANYIPTILYHLAGGERADALVRAGESAEIYGLKIIDLFMPTVGHHVGRIAQLVTAFHNSEPLANENTTVSLGILGSISFALLLIIPVLSFKEISNRKKLLRNTSILAYSGVILATTGGVSALICRLVFSGIRAYNRISVFLFFMALISGVIILDTFFDHNVNSSGDLAEASYDEISRKKTSFFRSRKKWLKILLIPLLILALYDQIPGISTQPYEANKLEDMKAASYFQQIEASVPAGTYIYQLPYVSFPEPSLSYGSGPYSQLAGYLNTKTLRWSYGALGGTQSDVWAKAVSEMPSDQIIAALEEAKYGGIYIDLSNYPDESIKNLSIQLIQLTGTDPIYSQSGQQVFIQLNKAT